MSLKLAIVADDLTGALDTGAPFVEHGLSVSVAIVPEVLPEALARNTDVVVVNTASRALPATEARQRVAGVAATLRAAGPAWIFKKIDSRLKGNIGAETAALAEAFGRSRIIAAPAVPDQGRATVEGKVVGVGVETPLPVADAFDGLDPQVDVVDAKADAELDALARRLDDTTLPVGARGMGAALARHLGRRGAIASRPFPKGDRILFAIGSRDPITEAQIAHLRAARHGIGVISAPDGEVPIGAGTLPLVVLCTGAPQAGRAERVARRFAQGVRGMIDTCCPRTLVMSGGDTALAVLLELGVKVVHLKGEAAAGIPLFTTDAPGHEDMECLVKSGGFGKVDSLTSLIEEPQMDAARAGQGVNK